MPALDRLSPHDFYRQLDWMRDEWALDVRANAQKVVRLRRLCEHLPTRYYEVAAPKLKYLALHIDYPPAFVAPIILDLQLLVSEWDRSRPPVLACEVCGVELRGHPALANHYEIVHPTHAIPAVPSA